MASKTSHIPPCPGTIEPEFFMPPSLFAADSTKSPIAAPRLMRIPAITASGSEKISLP